MNSPTRPDNAPSSSPLPRGELLPYIGLVAWVAFLDMDRLDLAGGKAGFFLTPFLVLTPLLLTLESVRVAALRLKVTPPDRRAAGFVLALLCLMAVVLLAAFAAVDKDTSIKRSLFLLAVSVLTLLVVLVFGRRPWASRAMATGAEIGLVLAVVFGVIQAVVLVSGGAWNVQLGPVSVDLTPHLVIWLPRFSGQVKDANRAALLLLLYTFLIARGREPGMRRRIGVGVGGLLVLLTLSRSALLAGAAAGVVAFAVSRTARVSRGLVLAGMVAVGGFALLLMAKPRVRQDLATVLYPVGIRFSPAEGSAESHTYLIYRGLAQATSSLREASLGVGYGDSFTTLQDVFPGNRYGNYHSLYVTMLVETGVFGLLFMLLLLGYPLARPGPYLPMIAALWLFDVFYQAQPEPAFWFILAMAWVTSSPRREDLLSRGSPASPGTPDPGGERAPSRPPPPPLIPPGRIPDGAL